MFEALTGQRPFPQAQPFALFQAVMQGPRPKATDIRPDLPPAVDGVLARALDADRARRFGSVEEFYLALSAALTGQSLSTTYNGTLAAPLAQPPVMAPPPAVAPSSRPQYQPVEEESTRGDLHTTLATGGAIVAPPNLGSTLNEGRVPASAPPPALNTTLASYSPPPASVQRPIDRPPLPALANDTLPNAPPVPSANPKPSPSPAPPAEPDGSKNPIWIVTIIALILIAGVATFLLLRR
jgi:serine/threonine-protein kinase